MSGTDRGGLAGVCTVPTVQSLIAENRQLAVPGWCTVAPVHGEADRDVCGSCEGRGVLGEDAINCFVLN